MDYSEIAVKIVNYILCLQQGQSVTISAEIHNVFDHNDPLVEIPFMEEIALVVRKNKGLPILDVSTENLHKRFFEEISDDPPNISEGLLKKWLETGDYFVDLSWRSNPAFYKSIPERSFKRLNIPNKDYRQLFEEKNKRLILLGYPTVGMAQYYDIEPQILRRVYFNALNVNYFDLKKRCLVLNSKLTKKNKWTVHTEQRALEIELINEPKCFYGDTQNDHIITLPTGYWQQEISTTHLNGLVYCDQIYHEQYLWKQVQIMIENGKVTDVATIETQKNINLLQTLLYAEKESITLSIGLNHSVKERCLYGPYDMVRYKNLSLSFYTEKGLVVALSEKASMSYEYDQNILDEV